MAPPDKTHLQNAKAQALLYNGTAANCHDGKPMRKNISGHTVSSIEPLTRP
jgi:hypothetical protein